MYTTPVTTWVKAAKYFEVHYAYPTSTAAVIFGKGKEGTYYLTIDGMPQKAYKTCQEAYDAGLATGGAPSYWSMKP